jgi:biotin carboxylase
MIATRQDAQDFVDRVGFPIVLKPPAGAGAKATFRVSTSNELDAVFRDHPPSAAQPFLAEEFLRGEEFSLETVSIGGRAVWHSLTSYSPTPLEVVENPWIQWTVVLPRDVDAPAYRDIRAMGAKALTALGMQTGVSHCEWFRREHGSVVISEIAARPPGAQITTMMSRANDIDFVRAWMALMLFGEFELPRRKYAVGTAFLRGQGRGVVRRVDGLDVVQREMGSLICDARIPTMGQPPSGSYEGDGFVMIRHPDTAVVEQSVRRIVDTVRVHLA